MNYLYVPSAIHPRTGREFGVAIVCRCAIDDGHKLPLPGEHALLHLRRAAAAGTLRTAIGGVRVYVVHLETPFGASDETRRRQALAILGDPHPLPPRVIVGGDFNGTDGADELARHQFAWLTRHLHDTAGPFDLDQILVRGLCIVSGPFVVRRPPLGQISDHRPVWTSIQSCPDE
jgi:endonuclease/exonuclease/phosphatase family metal-dependent hydrolase